MLLVGVTHITHAARCAIDVVILIGLAGWLLHYAAFYRSALHPRPSCQPRNQRPAIARDSVSSAASPLGNSRQAIGGPPRLVHASGSVICQLNPARVCRCRCFAGALAGAGAGQPVGYASVTAAATTWPGRMLVAISEYTGQTAR